MLNRHLLSLLFLGLTHGLVDNGGMLRSQDQQQSTLLAAPIPGRSKNPQSACDRFDDLPEECVCNELPHHHLEVECLKPFESSFLNDTVGILLDFDICNPQGSQLDIDLVERDYNITYTIAGVHAGEENNYPIPGWSIIIPGLGHLGMDVAVSIAGNPDMLAVKVGLNACLVFHTHNICAESVPGLNMILPWYILQGTYSFGDWCETATE